MNCSEVKKLIQLYMDSELEARDTLEVQRHLETCSSCNRTLQVLTDQDEKLRTAARAEVVGSVILRDRVLQAIGQVERPVAATGRVPLGGLVGSVSVLARVAAIVLVAGLLALILLKSGILHGAQNAVYADAIQDHQDHCMLENTIHRMYTDPSKIDLLTSKYCGINGPMDLSSQGLSGARARLCALQGKAYLHLLYFKSGEQNDGTMHQGISFFVRTDNTAVARSLNIARKDGLVVGSASRPGISLVVVSPFSEDETKKATLLALSELNNTSG